MTSRTVIASTRSGRIFGYRRVTIRSESESATKFETIFFFLNIFIRSRPKNVFSFLFRGKKIKIKKHASEFLITTRTAFVLIKKQLFRRPPKRSEKCKFFYITVRYTRAYSLQRNEECVRIGLTMMCVVFFLFLNL